MAAPSCSKGHERPWEERLPLLPGANTGLITSALALAAMGHLALQPGQNGDGTFCRALCSSPQQLLCLPVLCLLWKKMPGTKASIQTQADTAHLGLAGSSSSGFKASEMMALAKEHFAACTSLEKLCLLCYESWEKGL